MPVTRSQGARREALARLAGPGGIPEPDEPLFPPLPVYLTTMQLADYLGYVGQHRQCSAQKFIRRRGLRRYWRSGRVVLVKRADVDNMLAGRAKGDRE
jgi:hypothetical protein